MFKKQTTIDTGSAIMNVEANFDSGRTTFTTYINNVSIRGFALHVERSRETYIHSVVAAAMCPSADDDDRLTKELTNFIVSNTELDE